MCLTPIYIVRKDIYNFYRRGYDTIYHNGQSATITDNSFYKTDRDGKILAVPQYKAALYFQYRRRSDNELVSKYLGNDKECYRVYVEDYDDYYIVNSETGEYIKPFQKVPCYYCVVCVGSRLNKICTRCELESYSHCRPFFFTLTINDDSMEKFSTKETTVREIQLFLKRLRMILHREYFKYNNLEDKPLKYSISNDYCKTTKRLHFHGLLWIDDDCLRKHVEFIYIDSQGIKRRQYYPLVKKFMELSWRNGFVQLDEAKDGTGKYAFKYASKIHLGEGRFKVMLKSTKLGYDALLDHIEDIRKYPEKTKMSVLDKFSGEIKEIPISRWMSNIFYPGYSTSLGADLYRDIRVLVNQVRHYGQYDYNARKLGRELTELLKPLHLFDGEYKLKWSLKLISNNYAFDMEGLVRDFESIKARLKGKDLDLIYRLNELRKEHQLHCDGEYLNNDFTIMGDVMKEQQVMLFEKCNDDH